MKNLQKLLSCLLLITLFTVSTTFAQKPGFPNFGPLGIVNMSFLEVGANTFVLSFKVSGHPSLSGPVIYSVAGNHYLNAGIMSGGQTYTSAPLTLLMSKGTIADCDLLIECQVTDPNFGLVEEGCIVIVDGCTEIIDVSIPNQGLNLGQ